MVKYLDKAKTYSVDELKDFELPKRGDGLEKVYEEAEKVKSGEKQHRDFKPDDIFMYEKQHISSAFKCGNIQTQLKVFMESDEKEGFIYFMEQYDQGKDEHGMGQILLTVEKIKIVR